MSVTALEDRVCDQIAEEVERCADRRPICSCRMSTGPCLRVSQLENALMTQMSFKRARSLVKQAIVRGETLRALRNA